VKASYKNLITFVWVRDLEKAVKFYADILGCTRAYESEGWVELSVPGVKNAYLALNLWTSDGELPKNSFVTFGVEDLDGFREHLLAAKVHMHGDVKSFMDEGQGMRMFKFADPDGNILTASAIEQ